MVDGADIMAYQKIFRQGPRIRNMNDFNQWVYHGQGWVMMRGVPKHPSILLSMTYRTVIGYVNGGHLYKAYRQGEYE